MSRWWTVAVLTILLVAMILTVPVAAVVSSVCGGATEVHAAPRPARIDLVSNDQMASGMRFKVLRDEKTGAEYLLVEGVRGDVTVCRMEKAGGGRE